MTIFPRYLIAMIGLAITLPTNAQTIKPRDVVANIGEAIQANYYHVERGNTIATDLDRDAEAGDFDAHIDPRDLATALTARLKPLDAHFAVTWSPSSGGGNSRARPSPAAVPQRRTASDSGIQRVEILPGNIGLIDLRLFAGFSFDEADAPARRAIDAALQLVGDTDAVIIDLRQNGGGSPAMVGYLSSAFTPRNADIYNTFHFREGTQSEAPLQWHASPRLEVPLYVLISGRTGSAAEAFAYTMKNAGRASIVGEASIGAANPGGVIDVGQGFSIFVSNGSPVSPITHRNWEGDGVAPDLAVDSADALRAAQIDALTTILDRADQRDDIAARWALDALRMPAHPRPTEALAPYAGQYGVIRIDAEAHVLVLRNGRRPPRTLLPLDAGLFTVAGDPGQRVRFERDATNAIIGFDAIWADGTSSRYRRTE